MPAVEIRCPTCKKIGNIEIKQEILNNICRGVIAVNIATNTICLHSFIAYIDKNLSIRDYFTADFQIEIPDLSPTDQIQDTSIPEKNVINIDLIKLNLPANLICYILKSIFLKLKIIIIIDEEFLKNHIINFIKFITKGTFDSDLLVLSEDEYKKNKRMYKNSMVFRGNDIIRNANKIINPKKLKVEQQIVNRFLTEFDLGISYILLKNEIHKAFLLSKSIMDYANNYETTVQSSLEKKEEGSMLSSIIDGVLNKEKYTSKVISEYLNQKFNIKVQKYYLNFLFEIVENYFGVKLKNKIKI